MTLREYLKLQRLRLELKTYDIISDGTLFLYKKVKRWNERTVNKFFDAEKAYERFVDESSSNRRD